ncbi:SH3 domain-containing protein [[Clostridium] fimetarium]|uniref:SH3b domain-containing protein n=1 Tax=[Clostridium] fimetarium TaxID=99656 RepID=A0A1I0RFE3_9FIRM|nr:SH3 domain-containing protein [[Clostridium] fimetarium]SEW38955.1 protein of unknown function [[Clostridium] fimetarium]
MNRNRKLVIGAAALVVGATTIGMVSCYNPSAHESVLNKTETQNNASAVADKTEPQILGVSEKSTEQGTAIDLMSGISAVDNIDGDITSKLTVSGADFENFGTQEITYLVTDTAGNTAVVKSSLVVTEKILFACDYVRYITADSLSIRDNYSTQAGLITSVGYRDAVTVIATVKDTNWVKVRLADGTEGYCINDYFSETQPAVKAVAPAPAPTPTPTPVTPSNCTSNCTSDCTATPSNCAATPSNCASNCSTDCSSTPDLPIGNQNCSTGNPGGHY